MTPLRVILFLSVILVSCEDDKHYYFEYDKDGKHVSCDGYLSFMPYVSGDTTYIIPGIIGVTSHDTLQFVVKYDSLPFYSNVKYPTVFAWYLNGTKYFYSQSGYVNLMEAEYEDGKVAPKFAKGDFQFEMINDSDSISITNGKFMILDER